MKLNRMERWVVNSPLRLLMQRGEILWFQRRLPVAANATVLEIGCGRGAGAEVLRRRLRPAALHVLDLDPVMVAMARRRLTRQNPAGVHLCVADAVRLPYAAARFDAVLDCGPEAGQALAAIRAGVAAIRFTGADAAGAKIA